MVKRPPVPMFNWDLPDVQVPEDGDAPALTPEQWVRWFRTLPTAAQIGVAQTILELPASPGPASAPVPDAPVRYEAPVLRMALLNVQDGLRSALMDAKDVKPQRKRSALLVERITAIGVAIKGLGL